MVMLKIERIVMGSVQTNCYFLYQEDKKKIIVVDPADKGEYLYNSFKEEGFEVAAILLTHAHFDHIWGCNKLRELTGVQVFACEEERELCESAKLNVSEMAGRPYTATVDWYLKDGETVTIEGMEFKVIWTPGHTQGSCCYYFEKDNILISGDTLFEESVGRSDLPTGNGATLIRSLKERLMILPDETMVFPGHGDSTTIAYEKKYNPFCK
ncbi:MAG: MBL fold metallo-hydrolase [Lachnospiraceae bacterium]|nr:MBL fold metallo-hydrolase [Lachnospiraceae bacterium]